MDTGQVSLKLMNIGMPTPGGAPPSLATLPSKPGAQARGPFAGLLEVMTPLKTPQGATAPVSVGKGFPAPEIKDETASTTAVQDGVSGLMAGLLKALDASGKPLATGTEQHAEVPVTANSSNRKPQDVVLNAVGLRMALLAQADGGRMPQACGAVEQQTVRVADKPLAPATEASAEVPARTDTSGKKQQDVAMNAVGMQPPPLPARADGGRMPQADGTVVQQPVVATVADTAVTPLSNNGGSQGIAAATGADGSAGLNPHETLLNPTRTAANGPLKGASTDPTALEVVPKGNESQYASQKVPGRTTLPALPSRQVMAVVEQQNPAVVNSTASTERGTAQSNRNGSVGSAVAPVSGATVSVKGDAEVRTMASSGVEVTAQPQQEATLFRSASLEVALAESVPQDEVRITGQTQDVSSAQNTPVADNPAAFTEKTTQAALPQDISPANSGTMPVPVMLSPASSQQPGQAATTSKSTLEATRSVQAAVVPALEKMGTEAVPPERGKASNDGQGSVSGASAPQDEARTAGQSQDVLSAQDKPAAEIPAASTAKTAQTEPQQDVQPAKSGVMQVQVASSPASSQEPDQAVPANYQTLEGTGSVQAAVVPAAGKTGVEAGAGAVQTQPESAAAAKPVQSITVEAVKFAGAGSSGEKFSTGDDKGTADNFMNSQFHATLTPQQGNVDGAGATSTVAAPVQNNAQQSGLSEQILLQVKDSLVNHEVKAGNDQIVLRLSPENLGELKVNLSMDGQSLKVEIVAENHMVRDALLQHTDSLKESLARQNISMQSFNVTTGNPGQRQQQGDWRESGRQQQSTWMTSAGYQTPDKPTVANRLAYQTPSQHTMVDLHF